MLATKNVKRFSFWNLAGGWSESQQRQRVGWGLWVPFNSREAYYCWTQLLTASHVIQTWVACHFASKILFSFETIVFPIESDICHFYTFWLYDLVGRLKTYQNYINFSLKIAFISYKHEFLGQIHRILPDFFWKSGQGGVSMADSSSLGSNNNSLQWKSTFLYRVS